ncbi:MAG: hypothetical protein Marn2KO_15320 [Marinobacter nauticus]
MFWGSYPGRLGYGYNADGAEYFSDDFEVDFYGQEADPMELIYYMCTYRGLSDCSAVRGDPKRY